MHTTMPVKALGWKLENKKTLRQVYSAFFPNEEKAALPLPWLDGGTNCVFLLVSIQHRIEHSQVVCESQKQQQELVRVNFFSAADKSCHKPSACCLPSRGHYAKPLLYSLS